MLFNWQLFLAIDQEQWHSCPYISQNMQPVDRKMISFDSLNFFAITNHHAFQVSREVTCNSANLFKIFVGYFT